MVPCRLVLAMMYGFGDNQHPLKDTASAVEDAVVDYIVSIVSNELSSYSCVV